jgi:hypothetical protein
MTMRRVLTVLVLAGAVAFATPGTSFAQRGGGHAGGFSGGHAGGFSSGGFAGHSFGGGFSAPSGGFRTGGFGAGGGFTPRSFPAPRMNFMPGSSASGYGRYAPSVRPSSGFNGTRSPFGQLSIPAVRRAPYPGAANRGSTAQPYHGGNNNWHGGDHDGDHRYRPSYYRSVSVYSPYWPYYSSWYWPWWPYFGDWGSGDDYTSDTAAAPAQGQDQYYAPEPPPEETARATYPPAVVGSPSVAISEPTVTIIFKDGHSQQIRNYALTPTMLLEMDTASAGVTYGVPLELINLPATEQANRAVGVDFSPPIRN